MSVLLNGQTTVVNIANDSCNVYIGRGIKHLANLLTDVIRPGEEGWLGNPHPIGQCEICNENHTRDECIEKFKDDFYKKITNDHLFRKSVLALNGKLLGCYCKPEACHGDIIKQWIDKQNIKESK